MRIEEVFFFFKFGMAHPTDENTATLVLCSTHSPLRISSVEQARQSTLLRRSDPAETLGGQPTVSGAVVVEIFLVSSFFGRPAGPAGYHQSWTIWRSEFLLYAMS